MLTKIPQTKQDLEGLVRNQVQESIELDYKESRALGKSNKQRNEITKDVSAFANSAGGHIIYGISEKGHLPIALDAGCDHSSITREWLEQVINSNIAPKIDGIQINQITLSSTHSAFVITTEKSYRGPHQDRVSKKYYKRYNFESVPMEHYEIEDIRSRQHSLRPLINVDGTAKGVRFLLTVENIGTLPAEDVRFDFSKKLPWRSGGTPPRFLESGLKYFGPGKRFEVFYGTSFSILGDENAIKDFDVDVTYKHPIVEGAITDSFHIDFEDFLGTQATQSDVAEQGKKLEDAIKELTKQSKRIDSRLESLCRVASATGLELSVTSLRNLRRILRDSANLEKMNARFLPPEAFVDVLGVDIDLARRLSRHFWTTSSIEGLAELEGVEPALIEAIKRNFHVEEVE